MPRRVGRCWKASIVVFTLTTTAFGGDREAASPLGFAPKTRASQIKAEAEALATPTPGEAKARLRALTEEPHVAGTEADHKTAVYVNDSLKSWGWNSTISEYEVLLNYPRSVQLEIERPVKKTLSVIEEPFVPDKDSSSPKAFPAFHGYGISGEATGQIVYANYGRPEDFDALEKLGVDVKEKIVLVRYGELFRGLKILNAQKRGAIGVLIYSDPADDGYAKGDVYPNGPFRPESAIQRGSVQFLSLGPGDPSTPGTPSIRGAKRLPIDLFNGFLVVPKKPYEHQLKLLAEWEQTSGLKRDQYFATIPSLPLSYASAKPILEALGGANVPAGWQGALPLAYHIGPGPVEVRLNVQMDYQIRTIWNVIATITGSIEPDRWVMIGNHRDAWVYGAVDPGSGTAATLETCRAIGAAVKGGWKPRRTLVYASWDAEEYGLVGSTEWAEEHSADIDQKALMMLNVDSAVGGPDIDAGGVPSLRDLVLDAMGTIHDPRTNKTLRDGWVERRRSAWASTAPIDLDDRPWNDETIAKTSSAPGATATDPFRSRLQLGALGSGSDYTAFLDHLGVPSLDIGFSGRYGVYHSIYDNFYWMEKFGDPEFLTHATAAKFYAVLAMRAAAAEVAPLTFTPYGYALREYVDDLRRIVARKALGRRSEGEAAKRPIVFTGLSDLIASIKDFQVAAEALDAASEKVAARDDFDPATLVKFNDALLRVERSFLLPKGLPGRPWFRHAIYAPGLTTGYASWPLPAVRQAIIEGDAKLLAEQTPALVERIQAATSALRTARAIVEPAAAAARIAPAGAARQKQARETSARSARLAPATIDRRERSGADRDRRAVR